MNRVKTGIEGFDELINGGIPSGNDILISGPSGTGKMIFVMQFIYNGIKKFDEPGLFVTTKYDKDKIFRFADLLGWDFKKLEKQGKFQLIGGPILALSKYIKKTGAKVDDLIGEIVDAAKENDAKRIVIDSLNLFNLLSPIDKEKETAVLKLFDALSKLNCVSMLTNHCSENALYPMPQRREEEVAELLSDGNAVFYLIRKGSIFNRGIGIQKMKGTDYNMNIVSYDITNKGIVIYPKKRFDDHSK